ncbi:MAG: hypothetical protein UX99_C0026G0003 [Candidatus Amesbacteria bacterium GW2011_GWB1_47_26]|nr:MAG: hypothetical protein UX99_C0026G0003 [Candidatus Amesbacteria bacterium GW2011_GWB1_47_26]
MMLALILFGKTKAKEILTKTTTPTLTILLYNDQTSTTALYLIGPYSCQDGKITIDG